MGYLSRHPSFDPAAMRRAIVLGGVMASYAVEAFSLDRLRTLTPADIRARYQAFKTMTHFDDLEASLFVDR